MTNTDITRIAAIDIASQLPREIRDLILQAVVLRYYNFYNFDDFRLPPTRTTKSGHRDVLVPLISLINCSDPLLDYAVRLALPKLSFKESDLIRSRFVQQFANFALSKSTTRMYKFSTNTAKLSPLVEKLMESTFEQYIVILGRRGSVRQPADLQVPVFEQCSTLKIIMTRFIFEQVCLSGFLARSNKLKILELTTDIFKYKGYLSNEFANEIQNWFNVNPRNKTEKSFILHLRLGVSHSSTEHFYNLFGIDTFLNSTRDLNVRFDVTLITASENILNGINNLLTEWHEKFNGSLISYISSANKNFYDSPSFTRLIDTVSTIKIKKFKFSGKHSKDFYFSIDRLFQYSVSTVVDLMLSEVSISNFQNMPSLKRLNLWSCKLIGHDVLNGISEFCDELSLSSCKYDGNDGSITLPTSIGFLDISVNDSDIADLPKFSNLGKLQRLRSVKAEIKAHGIEDHETMILTISWPERFVAQLPSTVESLFLEISHGRKENISGNAIFHPEKLTFDNLTQLQVLYLLIDSDPLSTIPFNFSNLPDSLQELQMVMPSLFSGTLPKSLQSIDIDMRACEKFKEYETFADFWNQWIAPLENLLYFRAVNEHTQAIDSGALEFPPHLQVFDITSYSFEKISLVDGIPSSILNFTASRNSSLVPEPVPVFVRDDLQIDELKKRIKLSFVRPPWYKWVFREENEIE
ncbi:unnamed protein product [Ambrosiozyma monospora]|uniref:Unnamed protein product n=1 Tax=Ambrosiozyma monospora TaxID=43982 RepID=A0A9W6YVC6_AMBMO|nr:unnamed protein product [Ambrosiozyma monospora]